MGTALPLLPGLLEAFMRLQMNQSTLKLIVAYQKVMVSNIVFYIDFDTTQTEDRIIHPTQFNLQIIKETRTQTVFVWWI